MIFGRQRRRNSEAIWKNDRLVKDANESGGEEVESTGEGGEEIESTGEGGEGSEKSFILFDTDEGEYMKEKFPKLKVE